MIKEQKTNKYQPQDDIPYEHQMKRIIEDYKRLKASQEKLTAYAKQLEEHLKNQEEEYEDKIKKLKEELEQIRVLCGLNHIHEFPNLWKKTQKAFDDSEYKKLKERYDELNKQFIYISER